MTKEIPLTRGFVALVDDEDYAAVMGAGPWSFKPAPTRRGGYAQRNIRRPDGRKSTQMLHRFLTDYPMVDHVNGDGLDNRRENLRPATWVQNAANRPPRVDSRSGYRGVFACPTRLTPWEAQIHYGGKKRRVGYFATAEDAARAYDRAAIEAWGKYARTNFPREDYTA